ncbi:MAG: hypothetical protein Q9187_004683 [Circinaria calcarea]
MSTHQNTFTLINSRSGDESANLRDPVEPVLRLLEAINERLAEQTSLLSSLQTTQTLQKAFENHSHKHGDAYHDSPSALSNSVKKNASTASCKTHHGDKVYDNSGRRVDVDTAKIPVVSSPDFSFDRTRDPPPAVRYPYQWNYPRIIHPLVYAKLLSDEELQSYVGDLWQVPDDHRLSLTVTPNGLTEYFAQPKAEQHLQTCKSFLDSLNPMLLRIYDIDEYGQYCCYDSRPGYKADLQEPLQIPDTIWIIGLSQASLKSNNAIPIFHEGAPISNGERRFKEAVRVHLDCAGLTDGIWDATDNMPRFQIQWYGLQDEESTPDRLSTWKRGQLHHGGRAFGERCCTIQSLVSQFGDGLRVFEKPNLIRYWTLVILEPPTKVGTWDVGLVKDDILSKPFSLHTALLSLIVSVFKRTSEDWGELVDELYIVLGHDDNFLHPEQHDQLLWDDEDYSRSKKYFWCLSALQAFETNIEKNRKYWYDFRDALYVPLLEVLEREAPLEREHNEWPNVQEEVKLLNTGIAEVDRMCSSLEAEVVRLKHIRDVAMMMRDGLLNASSLREARVSTQLSEHIKLLTYASIFFLPLSFCMLPSIQLDEAGRVRNLGARNLGARNLGARNLGARNLGARNLGARNLPEH